MLINRHNRGEVTALHPSPFLISTLSLNINDYCVAYASLESIFALKTGKAIWMASLPSSGSSQLN